MGDSLLATRLYRANPEAMGQLRAVVEAMWQSRLDDLKAVVEAEPGKQEDP
jgi:hypothetical protein